MAHKRLKDKFPDKKLVKFISTTHSCSLSLKERWVYSTLLWRYNGRPVSKARLARWTGVDRTRTLPHILVRLGNLRLVKTDGSRYKAVEPPADMMPWFATWVRGFGKNERLVLAYNWAVYDPERDIIDCLVLAADALTSNTAAKLAKRYGVCAKTITATRKRILAAKNSQVTVEATVPKSVTPPLAPKVLQQHPTPPAPAVPEEERVATQLIEHLGISPVATNEITRLCRLLKGLSRKEIGRIVAALVAKYGADEGLEDAVWFLIQKHYYLYLGGTSLERVLADIERSSFTEDDAEDPDIHEQSETWAALSIAGCRPGA